MLLFAALCSAVELAIALLLFSTDCTILLAELLMWPFN